MNRNILYHMSHLSPAKNSTSSSLCMKAWHNIYSINVMVVFKESPPPLPASWRIACDTGWCHLGNWTPGAFLIQTLKLTLRLTLVGIPLLSVSASRMWFPSFSSFSLLTTHKTHSDSSDASGFDSTSSLEAIPPPCCSMTLPDLII